VTLAEIDMISEGTETMTRYISRYALPAILLAGLLAGCGQGGQPAAAGPPSSGPAGESASSTPSATPTPSASPTAAPSPPGRPVARMGPTGYGRLKLGMTKAQARKTGLTTGVSGQQGACGGQGDGYLTGSPLMDGDAIAGRLFFSPRTGRLAAIYAFPGMSTPEGIRLGSTYERVHAAYPTWTPLGGLGDGTEGRGHGDVSGNPDAHYRISIQDGRVTQLSLDSKRDGCYE
jgi:hypothetical protein